MISMRAIKQFDARDPVELSRAISQLETNASDAIDAVAREALPRGTSTNRKTTNYVAKVGELVSVDSTAGDVAVTLPVASVENNRQQVHVARLSAANVVTVAPQTGVVNLAASVTLAAATRLFIYESDGSRWWGTV